MDVVWRREVFNQLSATLLANDIGRIQNIHPHRHAARSVDLPGRQGGTGARGHHTWTPVPQVVDTLDHVFDKSFATAPQTNKRLYLGIDVSGSMGSGEVAGVPGLTPRMAAAAMAMAIARRDPTTTWRASQPGSARRPVRGPATGTPGPTPGWPHWTSPPRIASGT